MILALGARGPGFKSRTGPFFFVFFFCHSVSSRRWCLTIFMLDKMTRSRTTSHYPLIESLLQSIGLGPFQILVFLLAGMTYFAYACESLTFTFISVQVTEKWNFSDVTFAILPASTCVGNIIGGLIFSYLSDRYGRIWPYAACMGIIHTFVALSALSTSFLMLVSLRFVASLGVGGIIAIVHPMFIEFLPTRYRGKVTLLTGLVRAIGSCVTGGLAYWLVSNYTNGWRYFILATSIPSLFVVLYRLLFWVESPRYLINVNNRHKAWKTLSLIAKMNRKDIESFTSREQFVNNDNLQFESVHHQKSHWSGQIRLFFKIFKAPYLRTTLCYFLIYNTQNLAYYGSTLFLPTLLINFGMDPYFVTFTGFTAQIPGILLMAIIVEWPEFGRINTLRLFSGFTMLFFFLLGFVRQSQVGTSLFIVFIFFGMVPINTLLLTSISETYPTNIRSMTMAFMTASSSVNGIWLPFVSGYLASLSNIYTWLSPTIWGCFFLVQLCISLFLKIETRDRGLQDVMNE